MKNLYEATDGLFTKHILANDLQEALSLATLVFDTGVNSIKIVIHDVVTHSYFDIDRHEEI